MITAACQRAKSKWISAVKQVPSICQSTVMEIFNPFAVTVLKSKRSCITWNIFETLLVTTDTIGIIVRCKLKLSWYMLTTWRSYQFYVSSSTFSPIKKQVFWFKVPVDNASTMEIIKCFNNTSCIESGCTIIKWSPGNKILRIMHTS